MSLGGLEEQLEKKMTAVQDVVELRIDSEAQKRVTEHCKAGKKLGDLLRKSQTGRIMVQKLACG